MQATQALVTALALVEAAMQLYGCYEPKLALAAAREDCRSHHQDGDDCELLDDSQHTQPGALTGRAK